MAVVHQPDTYHVVMKAFVMDGEKLLVCYDSLLQAWDLPGGRINVDEYEVPFELVLERELHEELGNQVHFSVGKLATVFRNRRPQPTGGEIRTLALGYEVAYGGGTIQLSDEHTDYRWVSLDEAASMLPGGQQQGVINYIASRQR